METTKTDESERTMYISDRILDKLKALKLMQEKYKSSIEEYYIENFFDDVKYDLIMR
ncbi:hypothetical protein [Clostridium sp. Marseille-QA1073]